MYTHTQSCGNSRKVAQRTPWIDKISCVRLLAKKKNVYIYTHTYRVAKKDTARCAKRLSATPPAKQINQ